jgi:hypothetical protein
MKLTDILLIILICLFAANFFLQKEQKQTIIIERNFEDEIKKIQVDTPSLDSAIIILQW